MDRRTSRSWSPVWVVRWWMDATLEARTLGGSWQEHPCPHPSQGAKQVQGLEQEELEVEQQVQGGKEATSRLEL